MTVPTSNASTIQRRRFAKDLWRSLLMWLIFLPLALIVIVPVLYMFSMAFTLEANQLKFTI